MNIATQLLTTRKGSFNQITKIKITVMLNQSGCLYIPPVSAEYQNVADRKLVHKEEGLTELNGAEPLLA